MKAPRPKARSAKQPAHSRGNPRRRALLWTALFVLLAVAGSWFVIRVRTPRPPNVPLSALDFSLATLIQTSRAAVVAAPKSAAAWARLGQGLHAAEFSAEARLCYSNAAVLDKNDFRWPYLLGLLELQDAPDAAIRELRRATALAGATSEGPRFQLARALIERGQFDEAAPLLKTLLAANPNHAAAHIELARIYLARGELREATYEIQPALTNNYTMRAAYFVAAQIAQRNGQREVAAQLAARAGSLPRPFDWPDPVVRDVQRLRIDRAALADRANALLQQKRIPETSAAVSELLATSPEDPETLLLLGRLRYVENRCAEAEAAFRRHLVVQPNSLNGLIQLGLALLCQQKWTNAAEILEQAIALKADFAQAHHNLGLARSRAGDSAGAIRAYRDALRCNPGDVNAHIALAEELANVGELPEAKEHVRRAAEINPEDPRLQAAREQLGLKE